MNNLAQLFGVAPITAAGFTGQQMGQARQAADMDRQKAALDMLKTRQEMDHAAQMNPLKVQNQGLVNSGLEMTNRRTGMENNEFSQTSPSRVAAGISENNGKVSDAKYKEIQRMQGIVDEASVRFQNIKDPMQRTLAMSEFFQANQVDPKNPIVQRGLADPNALLTSSQKMKDWLVQNNPAYRSAIDAAHIKGGYDNQQERMRQEGANLRNTEQINAGRYNRRGTVSAMTELLKYGDAKKMYPALVQMAGQAKLKAQQSGDPADQQAYEDAVFLMQQAEPQFRAAMQADPRAGQVDLPGTTSGGVKANPPLNVQPPGLGGQPTQQPVAATSNNLSQSLQGKSVSDLKSAYPIYGNMSDQQLRDLVKKKFGVDLK